MLTVICCAYNVGTNSRTDGLDYIQKCLTSLAQTTANIRLIFIDDGSTDDTFSLASKHLHLFKNDSIMLHQTENVGLRDTFMRAVGLVETPYFLRIDADTVFLHTSTHWDKAIEYHFERHPECGGLGATQYLEDGRLWSAGDRLLPKYSHIQKEIAHDNYRICQSVMGCFSAYPKKVWQEVGGLTCPQWLRAETEDLNIRIQQKGYEIHCLPIKFKHCHSYSVRKTGKYNADGLAIRIADYMMDKYGYPFYTSAEKGVLPFLQLERDIKCL